MAPTPVDNAVIAVARAIRAAAADEADPDKLKTLADAAAALKYGPQGQSTVYRYEADYHQTHHNDGSRGRAGFQARP